MYEIWEGNIGSSHGLFYDMVNQNVLRLCISNLEKWKFCPQLELIAFAALNKFLAKIKFPGSLHKRALYSD